MKKNDKPIHVLWICTDQQRGDTVHALGNEAIHTPNLDRLCREGTAFTRAYCQNPVCTPSRASFLTGRYPSSVKVPANGNARVPGNPLLITKRFAEAGYRCGLSGKLHIASPWNGVEERTDDGYQDFYYCHDPWHGIGKGNQYTEWLQEQGIAPEDIFAGSSTEGFRGYNDTISPELHETTWCVDKAVSFIRDQESKNRQKKRKGQAETPWLFSLNIFDPHPPFDAPKEYRNRYNPDELPPPLFQPSDLENQKQLQQAYHQRALNPHAPDGEIMEKKASYYGMVELIDHQIGRLIDLLDELEIRENTLVIFHSDHGEMLGDHGLLLKGARFYEGAVNVPLIFSLPGTIRQGYVHQGLAALVDLYPTLEDLINEPKHNEEKHTHADAEVMQNGQPAVDISKSDRYAGFPGTSLMPLLTGESEAAVRDYVWSEYWNSLHMELSPTVSKASFHPTYATMYRTTRYKVVIYHNFGLGELYDLKQDPNEFTNRWDDPDYQEVKLQLTLASAAEMNASLDPGAPIIGYY